jgi:ABC-type bacteriocin/lantibiotic exporter with double-glycine peptidase domain
MPLKKLLKNIWLYGWILIVPLAILASFMDLLLLGGIRLFLSIVSGQHIIHIEWLKDIGPLHWILLMLAVVAVRYLIITLRMRSEERLSHRLESHLRAWWIRTLKKLHPSQFHKSETKSILHNSNSTVSTLPKGCKVVAQSVQAISQLLFFVPVLFWLSWQLAIVLLFIFAPITLYLQKSIKKAGNEIDDLNFFYGDYDSTLWRWAALLRFWNNQAELSKYLSSIFKKIRNLRDTSINMSVKDATVTQNVETISIFIMCIVLTVCAGLIKMQMMEPFQIILFCAALFICYKPLKDCSLLFSNLRDLRVAYAGLRRLESMEHYEKFFEERDEEYIRIENMSFRYGNDEPWIFNSLNNIVRLDRPLLIQGENGSGKTTLLRILSGMEIPQEGRIFVPPKTKDGTFYLSQRLFLPPISWLEQAVNEKKWSNNLKHFFEVLDLETLLQKHGHSNGELQRIGLAWAVVSGSHFLFLDEPFAFISQNLREPIFKAFWNATIETDQWWMMASHELPPTAYQNRVLYWKL